MDPNPKLPYTISGPAVVSCLEGQWTISFFHSMELALRFAHTLAETLKPTAIFCADCPPLTFAPGEAPTISEDPNARN